jgi:hypothetical protein
VKLVRRARKISNMMLPYEAKFVKVKGKVNWPCNLVSVYDQQETGRSIRLELGVLISNPTHICISYAPSQGALQQKLA